jgi:hypothetical protein
MKRRMLRALGAGLLVTGLLSCVPPQPAYSLVLAPGYYDVRCEGGFHECQRLAARVCEKGYDIETTRTDTTGSAMTIRCAVPKPQPAAPALIASAAPEVDDEPEPECTKDYQCTVLGSRCVKGACVIVPVVMTADNADRCVVGDPQSPDPVPLFPTASALTEFMETPKASRAEEFMLVTRLSGSWVDVGVRCRTLGQFARGKRVQLVSGVLAGKDGWMALPTEATIDAGAPVAGPDAGPKRANK